VLLLSTALGREVLQREILPDLLLILVTGEDHMVDVSTVDLLHRAEMAKKAHIDGRIAKDKVDTTKDHIIKVHHHHLALRLSQETSLQSWRTSESWLS